MKSSQGITGNDLFDVGQYYDLLHLLELTGKPSSEHTLLFNGDFVDRGSWSVEVILTLMAWKWLYPKTVLLNRGNHETKDMNKVRSAARSTMRFLIHRVGVRI